MPRDYLDIARKLRVLAADRATPDEQRPALLKRAAELEEKYAPKPNPTSPPTYDTIITNGIRITWAPGARPNTFTTDHRTPWPDGKLFDSILDELVKNQWMWNTEYYDRYGNPKPQTPKPEEDIVEEKWQYTGYDEDEDMWEGDY